MLITENVISRLAHYFNSSARSHDRPHMYDYSNIHRHWNFAIKRVCIEVTRSIELELCEFERYGTRFIIASFQDAVGKLPIHRITIDDVQSDLQVVNLIAMVWYENVLHSVAAWSTSIEEMEDARIEALTAEFGDAESERSKFLFKELVIKETTDTHTHYTHENFAYRNYKSFPYIAYYKKSKKYKLHDPITKSHVSVDTAQDVYSDYMDLIQEYASLFGVKS